MKCVTCKVDLDQHGTRDFETCLRKASLNSRQVKSKPNCDILSAETSNGQDMSHRPSALPRTVSNAGFGPDYSFKR